MKKVIYSFIFTLLIPSVVSITYKYMDHLCDSELDLDKYDSVRLKLTASGWSKSIHCYLRIRTNSNNRMAFYFKSFSVSCADRLYVRDGEQSNSPFVAGLHGKQCGSSISASVFETSGNYMYLRFSGSMTFLHNGFDMIVTSFHEGDCGSDEYSCRNGHCISDQLVCNGNNPCGDYSDCAAVIAAGVIAGIVVGSVALVVTVVTVVVIICRRRRVAYAGQTVGHSLGSGSTSTTALTQGYGQPYLQQTSAYPVGQQYPQQQYPQQYPQQPASAYPAEQQYPDKVYPQY